MFGGWGIFLTARSGNGTLDLVWRDSGRDDDFGMVPELMFLGGIFRFYIERPVEVQRPNGVRHTEYSSLSSSVAWQSRKMQTNEGTIIDRWRSSVVQACSYDASCDVASAGWNYQVTAQR